MEKIDPGGKDQNKERSNADKEDALLKRKREIEAAASNSGPKLVVDRSIASPVPLRFIDCVHFAMKFQIAEC
jgi:hypothetical protein